ASATSTPLPERPSSPTSVRPSLSQRAASSRLSSARPPGEMGLSNKPNWRIVFLVTRQFPQDGDSGSVDSVRRADRLPLWSRSARVNTLWLGLVLRDDSPGLAHFSQRAEILWLVGDGQVRRGP